jgi:23S rRNA U2552 (ribose-2'-O)-methylase RlmE/FtsJ
MLDFSIKTKLRDVKDSLNLNNTNLSFNLPSFNILTCPASKIEDPQEEFFFNYPERKLLGDIKNKINNHNESKDWDKSKKICNLYELIHISNNKMKCESISRYDPLSRSFFKLWEIINYFSLINNRDPIVTAHLAEGPGGFIEACLYYRQRLIKMFPLLDKYYGITLNSYSKEIPGWSKANNLIKQFKKNIEIDYGADNTGNLYNVQNIRSFTRKIKKGCPGADLVTADGGFDFSVNFNKQEQLSHRLILSEILTGIKAQKLKGGFICKIFDSYSNVTSQLLYFISCLYNEVYLVKPLTSRPANSEKYIVALSYKGFHTNLVEQYYISQLENLLNTWDTITSNGLVIKSIFENPPKFFYDRVSEYNTSGYKQQSEYIDKILKIIEKKPTWNELEIILDQQSEKAIEWCQEYHLSINLESYFYQKYQYRKKFLNQPIDYKIKNKSNQKYAEYIETLDKHFENYISYTF